MIMKEAREQIVAYGNRMIADRLTLGTSGNLSIYDPAEGLMAISPSGVAYADTKPEDIVIMDLEGNIVEGDKKPSSEHELHSVFYRNKKDVCAVVHAHSMYCTTLACMGQPLQSVHYALAEALTDRIPLVPYYTYGTQALADGVAEAIKDSVSRGVLLANHGMVACSETMQSAYGLALTMEWCAEVQWRAMAAGGMKVLTSEQMAEVMEKYKTYGQVREDGSRPRGYNG